MRNLEIIGEAVRHLSASQEGLPGETPWADIAGMRNILIHAYFGVDLKIIWHTIVEDLPKLKVQVRGLVPQADADVGKPPCRFPMKYSKKLSASHGVRAASRSEMITAALSEYVARHAPDEVADAINGE